MLKKGIAAHNVINVWLMWEIGGEIFNVIDVAVVNRIIERPTIVLFFLFDFKVVNFLQEGRELIWGCHLGIFK